MTGSYNGFAFLVTPRGATTRGINVARRGVSGHTSRSQRRLLVVAKDVHRATEIARGMLLHAIFVDAGPEVLARARKLGIQDNGVGVDDGQPS
jgi:hypothetical protein